MSYFQDLKKFIEEAEHGVIYISFGSVVKISSLSEARVQAILGAMSALPQRFIWKWESQTLLADKKKLYVAKWLPQVDILGTYMVIFLDLLKKKRNEQAGRLTLSDHRQP